MRWNKRLQAAGMSKRLQRISTRESQLANP